MDSLGYYQSLLSLLLIERDLVEEAGMMKAAGSARCFGLYIPLHSEHDTVKLNTSFTFIACGFEKLMFSYVMKIHDKFEITLKGTKVKIPIEHKIIGNAVVIEVTPTKAGTYVIKGEMSKFDKNLNYMASGTFRKSLYVLE